MAMIGYGDEREHRLVSVAVKWKYLLTSTHIHLKCCTVTRNVLKLGSPNRVASFIFMHEFSFVQFQLSHCWALSFPKMDPWRTINHYAHLLPDLAHA